MTRSRGERRHRLATQFGWATGILFVLVMAAGSDRPPPPGFLLIIAYAAVLGVLVGRALPRLLGLWDTRGAGPAIARAALGGLLAGLILLALTTLVSTGEPSIDVEPPARLLGFAIVGAVGALGAVALTTAGRLLDSSRSRP